MENVSKLAGMPILFIHGTRDVIVGMEHSKRLFEVAKEPKRLTIMQRGSHAEALFRDEPQAFTSIVNPWLKETLREGA